jgi:hypothetical protein
VSLHQPVLVWDAQRPEQHTPPREIIMPSHYDAIQLYDLDFGPRLVPVTSPGAVIAPGCRIRQKDRGKAPGRKTVNADWVGVDVNDVKQRCHDYQTAVVWKDQWDANVGFVVGDGYVVFDNDQGAEVSRILRTLLPLALRRYVLDPKHSRDAFLVRVVDGDTMEPEVIDNRTLVFYRNTGKAEVQILARSKQFVVAGVHPGTGAPYVWERELEGLDAIPCITRKDFDETINFLMLECKKIGWEPVSPALVLTPRLVSGPVSGPVLANAFDASIGRAIDSDEEVFTEAERLLSLFPNRDTIPAGGAPNVIDDFLGPHENWVKVGYALAAFLGPRMRMTPRAQVIWETWSDTNHVQYPSNQSSITWKSIIKQDLKFSSHALQDLIGGFVTELYPSPYFPDVDPADLPPDSPRKIWDELRPRWAYCKRQKGFVDTIVGDVVAVETVIAAEAWLAKALYKELGLKTKAQFPNIVSAIMLQRDRLEVFNVAYAPGDPPLIPSPDPKLMIFNRWRGYQNAIADPAEAEIAPWLDHLSFVLGTDAERDRFLRWCAFVVQHPRLKPNWHYLIISIAGLGKDLMIRPLQRAVGEGNCKTILSFTLGEGFNGWAEHKLVVIGETFRPGSRDAHETSNRLKPILASPPDTITINNKYIRPYEIANRCGVVMFSNDANPLYIERGDRRVHVVNRLGAPVRDMIYYANLFDWMKGGGADLCVGYLFHMKLTPADVREFEGGVAPLTTDKLELERQNLPPGRVALEQVIQDARNSVSGAPGLVVRVKDLLAPIHEQGCRNVTATQIQSWLMDMEVHKMGVRRCRIDPAHPGQCGVVGGRINGVVRTERLWVLADLTSDGRDWQRLSGAEIISIWLGQPAPPSAAVYQFPEKEEPV